MPNHRFPREPNCRFEVVFANFTNLQPYAENPIDFLTVNLSFVGISRGNLIRGGNWSHEIDGTAYRWGTGIGADLLF